MTSLVDISCWACGAKTRTTYRWLSTQPCLVCEGCSQPLHVDGSELRRGLDAIEDAMEVIADVTAELSASIAPSLGR
jgi:hypothetical protein